jgi:hypothetical protein
MKSLWFFLQGKKTGISNAIQLLLWYLYIKDWLGVYEAILISGILAGFGITANVSNAITRARDRAKNDAN